MDIRLGFVSPPLERKLLEGFVGDDSILQLDSNFCLRVVMRDKRRGVLEEFLNDS